jgi:hypothetical protein
MPAKREPQCRERPEKRQNVGLGSDVSLAKRIRMASGGATGEPEKAVEANYRSGAFTRVAEEKIGDILDALNSEQKVAARASLSPPVCILAGM